MRLWTLHPKYLDPQGLVAAWREALLAREVLRGRTRGYRHHPQLERFREHPAPLSASNAYLTAIYREACARGYAFDKNKLISVRNHEFILTTTGQLIFEMEHLQQKLHLRNPQFLQSLAGIAKPASHPLFQVTDGPVQPWERTIAPDEKRR